MEEQQNQEKHKGNWHDRHYKNLLIIPLVLIVFSFVYMGIFYSQNNDFFLKDISLKRRNFCNNLYCKQI